SAEHRPAASTVQPGVTVHQPRTRGAGGGAAAAALRAAECAARPAAPAPAGGAGGATGAVPADLSGADPLDRGQAGGAALLRRPGLPDRRRLALVVWAPGRRPHPQP